MKLFYIDIWWYFATLNDNRHHTEEITVVDNPYLLNKQVSHPFAVIAFLNVSIAHYPFLVGSQTRSLKISAPLVD